MCGQTLLFIVTAKGAIRFNLQTVGTGIRGLIKGLTTLAQSKQQPLVVKNKVERPQLSFTWASLWNVMLFPSVLWHCWLGDRKGIRPVKNWVLAHRWWQFHWSFAHVTAPVVTTHHLHILTPTKLRMETFWYRLTCWKTATKRVSCCWVSDRFLSELWSNLVICCSVFY